MSDWGQGFIWGLFAAGPLMLLLMGVLTVSGRESDDERMRRRVQELCDRRERHWTDEGTHSGEAV